MLAKAVHIKSSSNCINLSFS